MNPIAQCNWTLVVEIGSDLFPLPFSFSPSYFQANFTANRKLHDETFMSEETKDPDIPVICNFISSESRIASKTDILGNLISCTSRFSDLPRFKIKYWIKKNYLFGFFVAKLLWILLIFEERYVLLINNMSLFNVDKVTASNNWKLHQFFGMLNKLVKFFILWVLKGTIKINYPPI